MAEDETSSAILIYCQDLDGLLPGRRRRYLRQPLRKIPTYEPQLFWRQLGLRPFEQDGLLPANVVSQQVGHCREDAARLLNVRTVLQLRQQRVELEMIALSPHQKLVAGAELSRQPRQ